MGDDTRLVEIEEQESAEEREQFDALKCDVEARCKAAKIRVEEVEDSSGTEIRVLMPAGRDTVPVYLFSSARMRHFLSVEFEKYVLFSEYSAICSYELGVIEAGISLLLDRSIPSFWRRLLGRRIDPPEIEASPPCISVRIRDSADDATMSITSASQAFSVLGQPMRKLPMLRIENISISRHEDATALLERLANSLFFQLDVAREIPLTLTRRRRGNRGTIHRLANENPVELQFPRNEYDGAPLSLYWYARGAVQMPLLQFLAYYQAIEFYFPAYSQAEAQRKIRNILKDPAFRPERDADLARILSSLQFPGHGFGDERSQLRATFHECLEPSSLRTFLSETEDRVRFFTSKTEGITDKKLSIKNPEADLRNEVADRIYDIRCKIVHTKSGSGDGDIDLLLPFSREADLLVTDIELIQYVARQVLIAGSSALSL